MEYKELEGDKVECDIITVMKKILIANWKMNPLSIKEAERLAKASDKNGVIICPPFIFLHAVKKALKKAKLGAQNLFPEDSGSFTGEVSAEMLYGIGARYAILGHSERRARGENNSDINKKIKFALKSGLYPIICVGESERDEKSEYLNFIKAQLIECFANISKPSFSKIIIAYEPVWAIGKDAIREATAEEFREVSIFIKKVLSDKFGMKTVENAPILYGGSVHPENAEIFLREGGADGFLVGRDSLNSKKFLKIIQICEA